MKGMMKVMAIVGTVLLAVACADDSPTKPYTVYFKNGKLDTVFLQKTDTLVRTTTDTVNNTIIRTDTVLITRTKTDTVVKFLTIRDTVRLTRVDTITRTDTLRLVRVDTVNKIVTRVDTVLVPTTITRVDTLRITKVDTVFVPKVIVRVDTLRVFCQATNPAGNWNCSDRKP
jgi:hypothetical protein